jgi:hypothetical protein
MDEKRIQEVAKKLREMNKVISELEPEIREASFQLLLPYYFADVEQPRGRGAQAVQAGGSDSDEATFFNGFNHDKPADNVDLVVAWLYSQYGAYPVTTKEVRTYANRCGLTIPARPDATMRQAKKDGKKLYQKLGGGFQLTVHGEAHVKATYQVRKGTQPRPTKGTQSRPIEESEE